MKDPLEELVKKLTNRPCQSEDDVREEFVKELLEWLGYSYEEGEIQRAKKLQIGYYKRGSKRETTYRKPDYVIVLKGRNAFVVETKSPKDKPEDLGHPENVQQAHAYAAHREVQADFFILTNSVETLDYLTNDTTFESFFSFRLEELVDKKEEIYARLSRDSILKSLDIREIIEEIAAREDVQVYINSILYTNNKELKERTMNALSFCKEENYLPAINEFEDILRICNLSLKERIEVLINLGNAHLSLSQYDKAFATYNSILKVSDKSTLQGKGAALGNIALIYLEKGELEKSLEYSKKALKIKEETGDNEGIANALGNIGIVHYKKDELKDALENIQNALEINEKIGNRKGQASALGGLAMIYGKERDLEKALKYHRKTLDIFKEIKNRKGKAIALSNLGLIYKAEGELILAAIYLKESFNINKEIGYKSGQAFDSEQIGTIYRNQGNLKKALEYYQEALNIHQEIGNKQKEAKTLCRIGAVYIIDKGDSKNALQYLNQSLDIHNEFGLTDGKDIVCKLIGHIKSKDS
ncbi:tetratricopeptide repeat protein [Nanoarchaeota archaeon]